MGHPNQKTVAWLIAELQRLVAEDPGVAEYVVWMEGCDCYGELVGATVDRRYPDESMVTLTR